MVCHGELARTETPNRSTHAFYLVMSIGGALGGLFNALVAPLIFDDIYEYEIILVLASLMMPRLEESDRLWRKPWLPYVLSRKISSMKLGVVRWPGDQFRFVLLDCAGIERATVAPRDSLRERPVGAVLWHNGTTDALWTGLAVVLFMASR